MSKVDPANSGDTAHPAARRKRSRKAVIVGTSLAAAAVLGAGAGTYALWGGEAVFNGGRITAGDITVSAARASWQQVTPGVEAPASGGIHSDGFVSMPGDVIEFSVPYAIELIGENLNAELRVAAGTGSAAAMLGDGTMTATFRVEDESGTQLAPEQGEASLGEAVALPGLSGSSEGAGFTGNIIVTAHVLGDYRWTQGHPSFNLQDWGFGEMRLSLDQVRSGDGFVKGGE